MYELNKEWLKLEEELGHDKARIVAQAVSWAFRPDNWRFLAWYSYLKSNQQYVDTYFNILLDLEIREMSRYRKSDISHLVNYFKLPEIVQIYKHTPGYIPTKADRRAYRSRKLNQRKMDRFYYLRKLREKRKS